MRKVAVIYISYEKTRHPYAVDVVKEFEGWASDAGEALMKAIVKAQADPKAVQVSYFQGAQSCHISVQHSLINVEDEAFDPFKN